MRVTAQPITAPVALVEHNYEDAGQWKRTHILVLRQGLLKPPQLWLLRRLLRHL